MGAGGGECDVDGKAAGGEGRCPMAQSQQSASACASRRSAAVRAGWTAGFDETQSARRCQLGRQWLRAPRRAAPPAAMDFKGQELSEQLYQGIVFAFMLLALVIGYVRESYNLMLVVYAAGVLLAFVAAVPDWPYFNQNPVKWLPSAEKLDGKVRVRAWSPAFADRAARAQERAQACDSPPPCPLTLSSARAWGARNRRPLAMATKVRGRARAARARGRMAPRRRRRRSVRRDDAAHHPASRAFSL